MILFSFIWGIFKEALAKKIILSILLFFAFIVFLILYFVNLDSVEGVKTLLALSGQDKFEEALLGLELEMVSGIPGFMLFILFIILVSSFIPSMLKQGYIDLILSNKQLKDTDSRKNFINTLNRRNIIEKTSDNRFVFTSAHKFFMDFAADIVKFENAEQE